MTRHLKWAIPTAYVVVFVLVTSISHAMESPGSPQPLAYSPPSSPSSHVAVHHGAKPTSTSRTASPHYGDLVDHGGVILPDRKATPGAVNHHVTQANIQSTICRSGYSASVRPPSSYTTALKVKQLHAGYTYDGDRSTSDYEEDHLISLELGGSPTSIKNLWPEPYAATGNAYVKDQIENKLHDLVCNGELRLRTAQHDEASNWYAAYRKYILVPRQHARAAARRARIAAQRRAAAARRRAAAERRAQRRAERQSRQGYAPPPPTSCTTTSTGSCIQGGEFCPQADYGQTGTDADGTVYTCTGDSEHPHWE